MWPPLHRQAARCILPRQHALGRLSRLFCPAMKIAAGSVQSSARTRCTLSAGHTLYLPHKTYCSRCVDEFLCPSTKFRPTNLQWGGKTDLIAMYVGRLCRMMLFHRNSISSRVYFSNIWKLCWKIKIRRVDRLNGADTRAPGWYNASEMTQN